MLQQERHQVEIDLIIAFVVSAVVVVAAQVLIGDLAMAVIVATAVGVIIIAIGDARRRTVQRDMGEGS